MDLKERIDNMPKALFVVFKILVIIVFLIFIISVIANMLFNKKVTKEVRELFNNNVENKNETVQETDLKGLPLSVQKWLKYSQVVGKERIRSVRLKQKGLMRIQEGKPWMPTDAEQYFTIDKPGFIWKAKVKMAPLFYFAGRDKYYEGRGNMLIKILSVVPVVNAEGQEMDQGTLLRYLGETVWFPTAALSDYIKWEEVDENSAKATMSYGGVTASAVFVFNDKGEVINFLCDRYRTVGDQYILEAYSVPLWDYQEFNGIRIPTKGEGIWKLKTGDYSYYKVDITEIEYNKSSVY